MLAIWPTSFGHTQSAGLYSKLDQDLIKRLILNQPGFFFVLHWFCSSKSLDNSFTLDKMNEENGPNGDIWKVNDDEIENMMIHTA